MDINLTSDVLIVVEIKKKTSAEMFKNLSVGSKIQLSIPVASAGGNRGRTYASHIKITNLDTGESTYKTFNTITGVLNNFEFGSDKDE